MSDSTAFLAAIRQEPENDHHRLVYADWLNEGGDPLGDFIRVQCELPRLLSDDSRRVALCRYEEDLLRQHRDEWLKPLRSIADVEAQFRRGFVEQIHLTAAAFLAHGPLLLDLLPALQEVSLADAGSVIADLAACPVLERLRRLTLRDNRLDNAALAVLVASPHLARLVALDLSNNQIGREGIQALGSANTLPQLRHLDLSRNPIGEGEMRALADAPSLRGLETLRLVRNSISQDDFLPLATSPLLRVLTPDSVANLYPSGEGALALVNAVSPHETEHLTLRLDDDGLRALARSHHLERLKSLNLSCARVSGEGLRVLFQAPLLTQLESLDLGFMHDVGDAGACAIAAWPGLTQLRQLELICTSLSEKGVAALASSKFAGGLRWLRLSQNDIGDAGADAIASSPTLTALTELYLEQCGLGDRGATALAGSSNMDRLTLLALPTNQLTDVGAKALATSCHLQHLQWLNLANNAVSNAGALELANSPHLPALRYLDLRGCVLSRLVRRRLVERFGEGIQLTGSAEPEQRDDTSQGLLRTIAERPDEEEPRLAFADWLEEQDPERAEFIRIQCELVRLGNSSGNADRRVTLTDREQELLARNLKRWWNELPTLPGIRWDHVGNEESLVTAFDRGLFQCVHVGTLRQFEPQQDEVFGATVIRTLDLQGAKDVRGAHWRLDSRTPTQFAAAVAALPCLRQLRALYLGDNGLDADALASLLANPALSELRELDLNSNPLGSDGLRSLAHCPNLGNLESLNLSCTKSSSVNLVPVRSSSSRACRADERNRAQRPPAVN